MAKTKIVIITDAWEPQVNGVVTTYKNIIANLPQSVEVAVVYPGLFRTFNSRLYEGIDFGICSFREMKDVLNEYKNAKFHIATEGLLGLQAKRVLDSQKIRYTSAYHTKFPEFIQRMYGVPTWMTRWYFTWFHRKSSFVICSSKSNAAENKHWNSVVVEKGYDYVFRHKAKKKCKEPVLLYVGRVSKEKNIEEFCKLDYANKIVVGDGPDLERLQKKYDDTEFVGYKFGKELAEYYQNADVFVFPSLVDTYGIVILESMACGTPVAAYPVTGPIDQIVNGVNGYMDSDLNVAVEKCLSISRKKVSDSVSNISWANSAKQFMKYVRKL